MHVERHTYFAGLLGIISSEGRMKFFRHMTRTTTVKTNSRKYCRAKFHRIFAVLHQWRRKDTTPTCNYYRWGLSTDGELLLQVLYKYIDNAVEAHCYVTDIVGLRQLKLIEYRREGVVYIQVVVVWHHSDGVRWRHAEKTTYINDIFLPVFYQFQLTKAYADETSWFIWPCSTSIAQ